MYILVIDVINNYDYDYYYYYFFFFHFGLVLP